MWSIKQLNKTSKFGDQLTYREIIATRIRFCPCCGAFYTYKKVEDRRWTKTYACVLCGFSYIKAHTLYIRSSNLPLHIDHMKLRKRKIKRIIKKTKHGVDKG